MHNENQLISLYQNLVIKKRLTKHNANIILIKVRLSIKIFKLNDYNKSDLYTYQQLIRKLIYLTYKTRSNIVFIIGQLNRYNTNLKKKYLQVAKRVVKYLKGIMQIKLIFGRENQFTYALINYANSNFIKDLEN